MHILLIHQAFAAIDQPGGTRHFEFAQYLAARGHKITIITSPVSYLTGSPTTPLSSLPAEGKNKIKVIHVHSYQALHKSFIHRVINFFSFMFTSFFYGLRVKNVDVVWGTSPPIFQGVTAWLLARLKRIPFLFEVRDLWPSFAIAVGVLRNPLLIRMSLWLEQFLYQRSDRIVVNSPGFLAHVTERGGKYVDLIPNGSDPDMFDPNNDGAAFRLTHHLENKFLALYAGAHGLSNDLDVLLAAGRLLQNQTTGDSIVPVDSIPEIQIVLLGDGKEKPNLVKRTAEMGLANVTFLPPIPKSQMSAALASADACIAILKPIEEYKTTYPNKVFDYMAAGRPIVLAIDGVIREVVDKAKCGIFVQPGNPSALADAILMLAKDKQKSRQMGTAGRKYLENHFSRIKIGEQLIQVLKSLTKE